jgi:FkbH-like protein
MGEAFVDGSPPLAPPNAVAASATEARLAAIWAAALNRPSIEPHDDFFALGGDSLTAITVLFEIESAFGKTLPLSALLEAPTLRAFTRLIDPASVAGPAEAESASLPPAPTPTTAGWTPVIGIQTRGTHTPLFFVHGGGGQVLNFRRLSDTLGSDFPFYGLKTLYDEPGRARRLLTIEDMAARFVEEIRAVQPHGPYAIGGYSFGGVVAFEIAQRLRRAGEDIAVLALIDGDVAERGRLAEFGDYAWRVWQQTRARQTGAGGGEGAAKKRSALEPLVEFTARTLQKARHLAFYRHYPHFHARGLALPAFAFDVLRAHQFAERLYEPDTPLVPITFYRVGAAEPGMPPPPPLGWEKFAPPEKLAVIDVGGDHYNAMGAPSILEIAADLAKRIPRAARLPSAAADEAVREVTTSQGGAALPWLPPAPADWRAQLDAATDAAAFRRLATCRLNQAQVQQLGQAFTRFRKGGGEVTGLAPVKLGLLSNATVSFLAQAIVGSGLRHGLAIEIIEAPYGQTAQQALDPSSAINQARCDLVLLALDHRGLPAQPSLDEAANGQALETALEHLRSLAEALTYFGGATVMLQTVPPPPEPLFGHRDRITGGAPAQFWRAFNETIAHWAQKNVALLFDAETLAAQIGSETWHDPRGWFSAKLPFAQSLLPLVGDHVARLIAAQRGKSRRVLVLDLDNTVWGGVIGDDGMDGIVLGQGDARGEAHLALQQAALDLRARGVLLAVASKNEDAIARRVFREHPEMLLREEHITVFQANWTDKAANLEAIAKTLSLGLDALVFVDDNPAERERIRQALPMVAVPELPDDPALYARMLLSAGYFEAIAFSPEDRARASLYEANAQRAALEAQSGDLDSFLKSLDMVLQLAPFDPVGRARITQLINKTNQYNLTTKRYTEPLVAAAEADPNIFTLQGRLADRFGDNGMITVVIAHKKGAVWDIDTWLMSCRVLGRRVEEAVLAELVTAAKASGAHEIIGRYVPTPRNDLVRDHYEKLGFTRAEETPDGGSVWRLTLDGWTPRETPIRVERSSLG